MNSYDYENMIVEFCERLQNAFNNCIKVGDNTPKLHRRVDFVLRDYKDGDFFVLTATVLIDKAATFVETRSYTQPIEKEEAKCLLLNHLLYNIFSYGVNASVEILKERYKDLQIIHPFNY